MFANSRPSASNFKSFSRSLEQFFLTLGKKNFGNKIPFLSVCSPAVKRTQPRYYLNDINYKVIHDVDIHQHWNFRLDEWPIYTNQTPAKIKISFPCQ